MKPNDEQLMDKAIALARRGVGTVAPNPLVGAIIVRRGAVVGRGYHQRYGTAHAEEHALAQAGDRAAGSTAYVTLEPCATAYPGKNRPPCAPALIAAGISRVVCATSDPNAHVNGSGFAMLLEAGIEVEIGVRSTEATHMNRGFFHWMSNGRPFVMAKEAQTNDGYVAASLDGERWFTSQEARKWAHELRAEAGAVLIGSGTAAADDPILNVRAVERPNPLRVVLDTTGRLPSHLKIFNRKLARTLVFSASGAASSPDGLEVVTVERGPGGLDLGQVLDELGRRNVTLLLVEGGPRVHRSFMQAGLVQEVCIIKSQVMADEAVRSKPGLQAVLKVPPEWQTRVDSTPLPESILRAHLPLNSPVAANVGPA